MEKVGRRKAPLAGKTSGKVDARHTQRATTRQGTPYSSIARRSTRSRLLHRVDGLRRREASTSPPPASSCEMRARRDVAARHAVQRLDGADLRVGDQVRASKILHARATICSSSSQPRAAGSSDAFDDVHRRLPSAQHLSSEAMARRSWPNICATSTSSRGRAEARTRSLEPAARREGDRAEDARCTTADGGGGGRVRRVARAADRPAEARGRAARRRRPRRGGAHAADDGGALGALRRRSC